MFENLKNIFKKFNKKEEKQLSNSKEAAKERLHLVLMQDRANVSADFLELMKQEIIEVIKKYIEVDEKAIDVRLTNKENTDGTNGAPALYANIPILNIKNDARKANTKEVEQNDTTTIPEQSNPEQQEVNEEDNHVTDKKQEEQGSTTPNEAEKTEEIEETEKEETKKMETEEKKEPEVNINPETNKENKTNIDVEQNKVVVNQ